ncbi:uncharacterized protein KRP23_3383 [Phytophthora ramorum]|uniref:uncharacterized protein n=1 Tax=Phytophthora ramorum TaxID=164328 RepID=UPI003096677B|nr:hypothetical protein KRP23_3383 [Phytophthora ramorum]
MLSRRAAAVALSRSLTATQTRGFAAKPKIQIPVDKSKVHETPIVQNCGGNVMRWMGPGSRFQMYCALLLSGSLVYQADTSANMVEVLAASGAICSASVTVFFGAKRLCDKVVTDIVSCRRVGDPEEFVRVSIMGVGVKEVLEVSPKDLKLLGHDGLDAYSFVLGGRRLQLDTSTGECLNRKALDILMQGRPLVTRKVKQGKKGSRR